jgi:hypothetical protein
VIEEVFREIDFDDDEIARQYRDHRLSELQAQGLICTREDLYRVDGRRVYLVVATPPNLREGLSEESSASPKRKGDRISRPKTKFETR